MGIIRRYESSIHGNYKKGIIRYGLLSGIGLIMVVLIRYWIIYPLSQPVTYTENIALLILIIISLYFYKNNLKDKKITLKEGFILSLGVGVIASIIYGIFLYIYAGFIDLGFQDRCFEIQKEIPQNAGLSPSEIRYMTTPSYIAFAGIILSSVLSILWALLASIILRNERGVVRQNKLK